MYHYLNPHHIGGRLLGRDAAALGLLLYGPPQHTAGGCIGTAGADEEEDLWVPGEGS